VVEWPAGLRARVAPTLARARGEHRQSQDFWAFVQWCFDDQWLALKRCANERDVAIMGDLPIFVAHPSADCWSRPDLYGLDSQFQPRHVAGVPPDAFTTDGQRWGNPPYRWDRMAREGFAWRTARVRRALSQSDAFRIDHFRGFAGYWQIPASSPTAAQGRWVPGAGRALFEAIGRALGPLPIIAEDVGVITPDVVELRDRCGLPGMRVLKLGFGGGARHDDLPHNDVAASAAYTGTHDNDTVHGWWAQAPQRERNFAAAYMGSAPQDLRWWMIRAVSNSVASLAVFPLQDVLSLIAAACGRGRAQCNFTRGSRPRVSQRDAEPSAVFQ